MNCFCTKDWIACANPRKNGGSDGTRTRDLRRDRPDENLETSCPVPTFREPEAAAIGPIVGAVPERRLVVVHDYDEMIFVLRARADELRITRETLDAAAGLQSGV
jgi:hypothetical protein